MAVLPITGACLVERKKKNGLLEYGEMVAREGSTEPPSGLLNLIDSIKVKEVRHLLEAEKVVDLSRPLRCRNKSVIAVNISPSLSRQIILVVWSEGSEVPTVRDRELLAVYGCFARTVLANGLLIRDIRKTNRLLKRSSARLANFETLAALVDMTSGVANELNNAIGAVVGRIQLLREKLSDEEQKGDLTRIEELIIATAETVGRIQQFVSTAQAKDFEETDLARVISEVLADTDGSWKTLAQSKNVNVAVTSCCDDAVISGFEPDLRLLLEKLLDNAVEHAPENSPVEVSLVAGESEYQLVVSDHGSGVDPKDRDRIFYPFFTTKNKPGAGMSLAIVHGVVVRHGGRVLVSDQVDHGAIFTVTFPCQPADEQISEITGKTRADAKLRVLVVDDDIQIRQVLSDMLKMDGHEATTCCDGYEALVELNNGTYDLIITDLGMPGMSGLDLAMTVHEKSPDLPITMITGWGTQLDHNEIKTRGIKRVLSKPFHLKEIKALIAEVVR